MHKATFSVTTNSSMDLVDITPQVNLAVTESCVTNGICHLYNPHTTAALTINEGADPTVQTDIIMALQEIIPFDLAFRHAEGNSPSHVLASFFGASEMLFIDQGRLLLGTWQKIYFCEFDGPRTRKVHVRIVKED
jgi:secondary thiamine-phosphate synthase enzyme